MPSRPSPDDDGVATADLSGRRVGSEYVLICPVGQGATGTVWRGLESSTGDQVAVKLLHEGLLRQPKLVTRFVQERSILKLVRHEHVVGVRDLFSVGESLGLAMDFVAGGSLRERLRRDGPLAPGEAARLLAQVAAALAVAHGLGVVHRDVKPDNILLQADGEHPDVRLTDFGIARVLDSPGLTSAHAVIGTPHYMAPEAISGGEAAPAADVYALGIVLFELVCGRTPYAGEPFAVLRGHLDDKPRRPVGMPDAVWALIERCLDKDPARRPEAAALQETLRRLSREVAGVPAMPAPAAHPGPANRDPVNRDSVNPEPARPDQVTGANVPAVRPRRPKRRPPNLPRDWAWGRRGVLVLIIAGGLLATGIGGYRSWRTPASYPGGTPPNASATPGASNDKTGNIGRGVTVTPEAGSGAVTGSAQPGARDEGAGRASSCTQPGASTQPSGPVADCGPVGGPGRNGASVQAGGGQVGASGQGTASSRTGGGDQAGATGPVGGAGDQGGQTERGQGAWQCGAEYTSWSLGHLVVAQPCQSLGDRVEVMGHLEAPPGTEADVAVSVISAADGGLIAGPHTCRGLTFTSADPHHECGPVALDVPRGGRYVVQLTWRYPGQDMVPGGTTRGNAFSW